MAYGRKEQITQKNNRRLPIQYWTLFCQFLDFLIFSCLFTRLHNCTRQ